MGTTASQGAQLCAFPLEPKVGKPRAAGSPATGQRRKVVRTGYTTGTGGGPPTAVDRPGLISERVPVGGSGSDQTITAIATYSKGTSPMLEKLQFMAIMFVTDLKT